MTRCKVGDLAVVISDEFPENIGALVEVFKQIEPYDFDMRGEVWWRVNSLGRALRGDLVWWGKKGGVTQDTYADVQDARLRPVHPGEGTDEMIRIAGKPQETPADIILETSQTHLPLIALCADSRKTLDGVPRSFMSDFADTGAVAP